MNEQHCLRCSTNSNFFFLFLYNIMCKSGAFFSPFCKMIYSEVAEIYFMRAHREKSGKVQWIFIRIRLPWGGDDNGNAYVCQSDVGHRNTDNYFSSQNVYLHSVRPSLWWEHATSSISRGAGGRTTTKRKTNQTSNHTDNNVNSTNAKTRGETLVIELLSLIHFSCFVSFHFALVDNAMDVGPWSAFLWFL